MDKELKKKAEQRLGKEREKADSKLIHDLKVYQIELEIQNEELRNTEAALQGSRDQYVRLYNQAPVGYITVDQSGLIRQCNHTFIAMTGSSSRDPKNRAFADFLVEEDRQQFLGRFRPFFKSPEGKSIELSLNGPHGPIQVLITASRETGASEERLLLVIQDISERRTSERKIHALLDEKEIILREVHHRVKNNMNTIMGLLSLQAAKLGSGDAASVLLDARHRVETMLLIYDSLYRSGNYRTVDMGRYLSDLLNRIELSQGGQGSISLRKSIEAVELDASLALNIGIVINELVTNAFKYAFPPGVRGAAIETAFERGEEGQLRLMVRDNGKGLPEAFSIEAAEGFGLTLVQGLVGHMNGTLRMERLEPGTEFSITVRMQ